VLAPIATDAKSNEITAGPMAFAKNRLADKQGLAG
jgi:hypothetical protein